MALTLTTSVLPAGPLAMMVPWLTNVPFASITVCSAVVWPLTLLVRVVEASVGWNSPVVPVLSKTSVATPVVLPISIRLSPST